MIDDSIFQLRAVAVGDALDVDEQFVVRAARPRIFDRNGAVNPVPLALEHERDSLCHHGSAVFADGDVVLKISNAPGFGRDSARLNENTRLNARANVRLILK